MGAQAVGQFAPERIDAAAHVGDGFTHRGDRVGPGEEHVGGFGSALLGGLGEATEIHRRATRVDGGDSRRVEVELGELTIDLETLTVEQ